MLSNDPETGCELLLWKAERGSKTRHGDGQHQRAFYPTARATENNRCSVQLYICKKNLHFSFNGCRYTREFRRPTERSQEFKKLDSYKSASTAHRQKMSLVLSRSTPPSCATGSKRLHPLETNQTNEAFNNNVQQNLSYSSSSAVEGMFSGATIQKVQGCNFNFYFNASKSPIRGVNRTKKRRVILSDDSESD